MKRIKTREVIEKERRRNKTIVGIVLIGLLLFSSLGYAFYSSGGSSDANVEEEFQQGTLINGKWVYQIEGHQFLFTNFIGLAEKVPVDIQFGLGDLHNQALYIDANDEAYNEIGTNLGIFVSRIQRACYGDCEEDLPEKDCSENLIVVKSSEDERVYQEEKCIFIDGDLVAVDAFLYRILGFL